MKLCFDGYWDWMLECEKVGLSDLEEQIDAVKEDRIKTHEESVEAWRVQVQEWGELLCHPLTHQLKILL